MAFPSHDAHAAFLFALLLFHWLERAKLPKERDTGGHRAPDPETSRTGVRAPGDRKEDQPGRGPSMHGEQLQGAATMAHHPTQDTGGAGGCPSSHCPGTGSKEQGRPRTAGHVAPWSLALTQSTLAFPWRQSPSSFQQEDLRIKDQRGRLAWGRELAPGPCGGGERPPPGPVPPLAAGDVPAGLCPRPPAADSWDASA